MPRRVNRCLNPVAGSSFGLAGTSNSGGGAATTRGTVTDFGRSTNTSYRVIFDAAAAGGWCYLNWGETAATNPAVSPGEKLTFWAWVYTTHTDIGARLQLQWSNAGYGGAGSTIGTFAYGLNDGQWHQLRLDATVPAGAAFARMQVEYQTQSAGPAGQTAWVTDLMLAPTGQGSAFGYGGLPGWRWLGPAHQSGSQELRGGTRPGLLLPV